jgi:hypothetical protein
MSKMKEIDIDRINNEELEDANLSWVTKQEKMCAVCGDKTPLNVRLKWKRNSDKKVFHVCAYCAEQDLVNADSVKELTTQCYTTVTEEGDYFLPRTASPMLPKFGRKL